jgi:hypothetical protein
MVREGSVGGEAADIPGNGAQGPLSHGRNALHGSELFPTIPQASPAILSSTGRACARANNLDVPTMPNRDPRPLFILELANNHMGDLQHGLRIIRDCHEAARPFRAEFRVAFKLQYRHLESFIHLDYAGRSDLKYVKRFSETRAPSGSTYRSTCRRRRSIRPT